MWAVHCVDSCRNAKDNSDPRGVLFTFRAALDSSGVAVWVMHEREMTWYCYTPDAAKKSAKALRTDRRIPFIDVSTNRPVTPAQAMRLTGMTLGAAALDFITSQLQDGLHGPGTPLANYVKPPKEKAPKPEPEPKPEPTPLDDANKKLEYAGAKCDEWLAAIRHAQAKHKEWRRKYKARERRVAQLQVAAEGVAELFLS